MHFFLLILRLMRTKKTLRKSDILCAIDVIQLLSATAEQREFCAEIYRYIFVAFVRHFYYSFLSFFLSFFCVKNFTEQDIVQN